MLSKTHSQFMNIRHLLNYCLGVFAFLCLYACQTDTVYYTYNPISTDGWKKTDTLQFYLPDTLSLGTYHLEVGIRHTGKYPYRDVWLELIQYLPKPNTVNDWIEHKDTIHIYLANEKGVWNGTGTTSGHFQLLSTVGDITIDGNNISSEEETENKEVQESEEKKITNKTKTKSNTSTSSAPKSKRKKYTLEGKTHRLGKMANHHLKVTHIMTDSLLLHVSDVGLRLSKK